MNRTIRWNRRSLRHLEQIGDYVGLDNAVVAERLVGMIAVSVMTLAKQPSIGRPGRVVGTREFVVVGTPYIVAYRVGADDVEILAVLHGAQQWPSVL